MEIPAEPGNTPATTSETERSRRPLRLRPWSEEEFLSSREGYEDLLSRSEADPLFMSWEWLTTWWDLHKGPYGLSFVAYSVETEDGRLMGLAPMTRRRVRHRGGFSGKRLELLGALRWEDAAALTEYVNFPVDPGGAPETTRLLAGAVFDDPDWDDLCLSFMPMESDTWRTLLSFADSLPSGHTRPVEVLEAHRIDLQDGFDAFLSRLGSKTRLRVFNGRKRLSKLGPVEFVVAGRENLEDCIRVLNDLHSERWGSPALMGLRGKLYRRFAEKGVRDGSLALSHLSVGGEPLAAALNLRAGDCEYGIQSGLGSSRLKGVSPGYLQIGFMVERCCSEGVRYFDFLAAEGREKDYRRHFPTEMRTVGSAHIIRKKRLAAFYRSYDSARTLWSRIGGNKRPAELTSSDDS
jgi:hypothetical protein